MPYLWDRRTCTVGQNPNFQAQKFFPSGLVKDKLDQMSSHTSEDSATAQDEQMAYPR